MVEGERKKVSWVETPLNTDLKRKKEIDDDMFPVPKYTISEHNDLCERSDAVIELLRNAGGTVTPKEETLAAMLPSIMARI